MPKEELVEGIRQAVSKGEPMQKAMMAFYSAGYKKEDIEEAAAAAQSPGFVMQPQQQTQQPGQQAQTSSKKVPQSSQPQTGIQPGVVQRVSAYSGQKPPSKKGTVITILLVAVLLLLLGLLAAVILFKDEISTLFDNLVWRALF